MDFKSLGLLESLASDAVTLVGQVFRTFRDILLRPRRLALSLAEGQEELQPYVPPYTFLGLAGFLGTNAVLITATSFILLARVLGETSSDTLSLDFSVLDRLLVIPPLEAILKIAIPVAIAIHVAGRLFGASLSRVRNEKVRYVLHYTAGLQYLLLAAFALLTWVGFGFEMPMLGCLGLLALLGACFAVPLALNATMAGAMIDAQSRKGGRAFKLRLGLASALASAFTLAMPLVAARVFADSNSFDLRSRAVLHVVLVDEEHVSLSPAYSTKSPQEVEQWIRGDKIEVTMIVTNQAKSEVVLLTRKSWLSTESSSGKTPTRWAGRLSVPGERADLVFLAPKQKVEMRFVGERDGGSGLTVEARARIELLQVLENGALDEIRVHAWKESIRRPWQ